MLGIYIAGYLYCWVFILLGIYIAEYLYCWVFILLGIYIAGIYIAGYLDNIAAEYNERCLIIVNNKSGLMQLQFRNDPAWM